MRKKLSRPAPRAYIAAFMVPRISKVGLAMMAWLLAPACDFVGVEPTGDVPVLSDLQASLDDRDNRFYAAVTVTIPDGNGTPDSIWVELYLATGKLADSLGTDVVQAAAALVDDATGGDILPQDEVYASKFDSPFPPESGGSVRFEFLAIVGGDTSQETTTLRLVNLRPVVLQVTAADSLRLPPEGFFTIDTVRARVDDPDGLIDIREVSFTTLKPDGTLGNDGQPIDLADNGDLDRWGDAKTGDGLYSQIIELNSDNLPGTYVYRFIAKDFAGAVSDTVSHQVVVQ
ncbi:MAG: hypothetical protein V3U35_02220 [Candidatus Neomarinimicrobiota bacterium]